MAPLIFGSRGHFKFQGANPAPCRPRNIPVLLSNNDEYDNVGCIYFY